jgi:hypothetical protein
MMRGGCASNQTNFAWAAISDSIHPSAPIFRSTSLPSLSPLWLSPDD